MPTLLHLDYNIIRNNVIDMLKDRGVVCLDGQPIESLRIPDVIFKGFKISTDIDIKGIYDPLLSKPVYVRFFDQSMQLKADELKRNLAPAFAWDGNTFKGDDLDPASSEKPFYLILIANLKDNSRSNMKKRQNFETWNLTNLMYNPTKHVYVPRHILLSKEEADIVVERYSRLAMPKLLETDVQARWLRAKPGNIIQINRNNDMTYRVVIADQTEKPSR